VYRDLSSAARLAGGSVTVQHAQAAARYQAITDLLTADGRVDVVDIANRLGVAQETIRRDLRAMESAGNCSEFTVAQFGSPLVHSFC
jgi:predicted ArsR family transcriptional regulator